MQKAAPGSAVPTDEGDNHGPKRIEHRMRGVLRAADVVVPLAGLDDVTGVVGVLGPAWADPFVVDAQAVRPIVATAIATTAIPRT